MIELRFLKNKQVFDFAYDWAKYLIKFKLIKPTSQQKSFHLFLSGDGGCGKSHLIKTVFRHTGKQGPRTLEGSRGPRILDDPGPLRTQDSWGPRTYIFINKKYIKKCLQFSSSENISVLYEKLRIWYKLVNTVNFIIHDLLRPVTKTVLVFDIKWWQK